MKVFISWSGEISKRSAEALKEWLEQCIQSLEVFFSPEDIAKGTNWQAKLSNELKDTNYGIICLTSENTNAPWIHFEAGALSKILDSKVMVLAINISFSEIVGPLKTFQATKIEKDDVFKLLQSINNSQEKPLSETKLHNSFEAFWPQLIERLKSIKKSVAIAPKTDDKEKQTSVHTDEVLDEILQLVRNQNALFGSPEKLVPLDYLEYAFARFSNPPQQYLDEIYSFTRFIISEEILPLNDPNVQSFFENYRRMVFRLCRDSRTWKKRFSSLFSQVFHSSKYEIPDEGEMP